MYLDVIMLLNFLVDFLLLMGTNQLSGFPPGAGRCAVGALLGAVYSGMCLLPGFSFLGNTLWRLISFVLLGMTAFGLNRSALRRTAVFGMLSMALGGIALQFSRGQVLPLLLCGSVLWLLCRLGFGEGVGEKEYIPVTLSYGGKRIQVIALRDTGNQLRDPVTGEKVLVLSAEAAKNLTGLSDAEISHPLETLAKRPIPGLRLVPYRAVGSGGMLLALRIPEVIIGKRKQSAVAAFAPEGFAKGDMVQALTGGAL